MFSFTKDEKARAYNLLSPAEKGAAFSESIAEKIATVATKYGLNGESADIFKFSIGLYILKLITADQLPEVLTERFPGKPVADMMNDIKSTVFPEIEKVKFNYVPEITEEAAVEAQSVPSPYVPQEHNIEKNINEAIDRADILKAIESGDENETPTITQPAAPTAPKNSVEERLKGVVFTPKEEKIVRAETPKSTTPTPSTAIPKYTGKDPYREEI